MRRIPWSRLHRFSYAAALISIFVIVMFAGLALGHATHQETSEANALLEFNHHVGGLIVLVLAVLAWVEVLQGEAAGMVRLGWPSCLILTGSYNLIWSDKFAWPIGPSGLAESLANPQVLQHKTLAVAMLMLGVIDLLRRLKKTTHTAWLFLFYGIAMLTGGILLLHDSGTASHAHLSGVTTSHVLMGFLALLTLVCKVLVDHRLIVGWVAYLYPLLLLGLGMQLLLFTESSGMGR
jgi:hypothetical protein